MGAISERGARQGSGQAAPSGGLLGTIKSNRNIRWDLAGGQAGESLRRDTISDRGDSTCPPALKTEWWLMRKKLRVCGAPSTPPLPPPGYGIFTTMPRRSLGFRQRLLSPSYI